MKIVLLVLISLVSIATHAQTLRTRMTMLMGARFDITIVAKDSLTAEQHIDTCIAEIKRIEYLISDWIDTTQVSRVNQYAGIAPVEVDQELIALTLRAIRLSRVTSGAFDISFAAMEKIWRYDGSMTSMPSAGSVARARQFVGYQQIVVDSVNHTIFLPYKGMKIGFGALGEGYAADRCRQLMEAKGIQAGIVNGSGDMNTWGKQPDGSPWNIGIADPFRKGKLYAVVPLQEGAVVTSGSYEKYVELGGKRYSHIINPATGYPATGLTSVTVFGPMAELANGLSTSIMVMGTKRGLELLAKYPGYSCLLITDKGRFIRSCNLSLKK
jgi:FAD:protein FMN transferase